MTKDSTEYTVLARKWRPKTFEEVVGQDVVVRTLGNAISRNRVAHAYLFAGSRGTGKTTVARILARALNCEKGPTPTPCGACHPCREILQGTSLDVLEIDGASTRGIDDVRQLRENVRLTPSGGRKKVYIIDEVHMLTPQAFNALLKTLEEPPAHVVFILATTDPQKLPETILSRCQRFNFARIPVREAVTRLAAVVSGEKITLTEEALILLARRSGGALRDALGFLDQILSAGIETVDEAAVVDTLGLVGSDVTTDLVEAFIARDPGRALERIWEVQRGGQDVEFLLTELLDLLRNLLVVKCAPDSGESIEVSAEERKRLVALAEPFEVGDLLRLVRLSVGIADQVRHSDYPWIHLEVGVVEMASLDRVADITELLAELRTGGAIGGAGRGAPPGTAPGGGAPARPSSGAAAREERSEPPPTLPLQGARPSRRRTGRAPEARGGEAPAPGASPNPPVIPIPDTRGSAAEETRASGGAVEEEVWGRVLDLVREKKPIVWSILSHGDAGQLAGDTFTFHLDPKHAFHVEALREPAHIRLVEECLESVYDRPLGFEVHLVDGAGKDAMVPKERRKVLEDPFVKKLLQHLDGEILG